MEPLGSNNWNAVAKRYYIDDNDRDRPELNQDSLKMKLENLEVTKKNTGDP